MGPHIGTSSRMQFTIQFIIQARMPTIGQNLPISPDEFESRLYVDISGRGRLSDSWQYPPYSAIGADPAKLYKNQIRKACHEQEQ